MHPILYHLPGGAAIHSYGFMLGLAFTFGWLLTRHFATRDGYPERPLVWMLVGAFLGAMLGARVVYFIGAGKGWDELTRTFWRFQDGGLVAYGGFIFGTLVAFLVIRGSRLPFWRLADHAAPGLALGLAITRIGCFLYGCDFGKPCGLPWAIAFPAGSPAWRQHRELGLIEEGAVTSLPVHPTQLYASLYGIGLFLLLLWARRLRVRFRGQSFLIFIGTYAILRFGNEILRDDSERGQLAGLSTSQWIAIATLMLTAFLALTLPRETQPDRPLRT